MKNKIYILLTALLLVFAAVFVLRFVVGGDEDTWICEDGAWVKHGQPVSAPPSTGCGQKKLIGGDEDEHGCLIAAGYSWCGEKTKCLREWEEPCTQEKAFTVLSKLKKDSDLSFSGIGNTSFKWFLLEESEVKNQPSEKEIQGKIVSVEDVNNNESSNIDNFFKKNNFLIDPNNLADGTFISKTGYKKENMVCLITKIVVGYDPSNSEKMPDPLGPININVECSEIIEE